MNSHQLVIRCDTTNGYYKIGWSSELPLGRFEHLEILIESEKIFAFNSKNPQSPIYQQACKRVSKLNKNLIIKEQHHNLALGWFSVSLNLNDYSIIVKSDDFGCYNNLATQTRYRLSKNSKTVWAVIKKNQVVHIIARYPTATLPELKYQIWKNNELNKLNQYDGFVCQGKLLVCSSGLWFVNED